MRYSESPGGLRGERPRASRRRGFPLRNLLLLILGFSLSGLAGVFSYYLPVLTSVLSASQNVGPIGTANAAAPGAPFTVLLLGSDDDGKEEFKDKTHLLTQSMILVRVDTTKKPAKVTMFSIARDSYVPFSTGGRGKIDEVYSVGGAPASIRTVEQNFQIHVDHYAWIGLLGLIHLVDKVGGVDMVIDKPVLDDQYPADLIPGNNPYSYQRVAVLPGPQHLDGYHAMLYVRSRHSEVTGDFERSARQQGLLLALRTKVKSMNAANLPDLTQAFNNEVKTDLQVAEAKDLLPLATGLTSDGITSITMHGLTESTTIQRDGQTADIEKPIWPKILPLVHQYFPPA